MRCNSYSLKATSYFRLYTVNCQSKSAQPPICIYFKFDTSFLCHFFGVFTINFVCRYTHCFEIMITNQVPVSSVTANSILHPQSVPAPHRFLACVTEPVLVHLCHYVQGYCNTQYVPDTYLVACTRYAPGTYLVVRPRYVPGTYLVVRNRYIHVGCGI